MSEAVKGLRAARIADTEERILAAAHELFVRSGYVATTLTAVAEHAGVAHRTVYVRFGTKAALLKRVVDVAVVGDTELIDVASRDWYRRALSAPTLGERIDAFAEGASALMGRAGDVIAVSQQAEHVEPIIAAAARAGREATRDSLQQFFGRLRDDHLVASSCDIAWVCDTAGVLSQAETYLLIRNTLDWTVEQYRDWLVTTWHRLLSASEV